MDLYRAIVKMEQEGSADGTLQVYLKFETWLIKENLSRI